MNQTTFRLGGYAPYTGMKFVSAIKLSRPFPHIPKRSTLEGWYQRQNYPLLDVNYGPHWGQLNIKKCFAKDSAGYRCISPFNHKGNHQCLTVY